VGDVVVMMAAVVGAGALMVFVFAAPVLGWLLVGWAVVLSCAAGAVLVRREIRSMQGNGEGGLKGGL